MGDLIGVNFGKFLPYYIKLEIKEIYLKILDIISQSDLDNPDFAEINAKLVENDISGNVIKGGKDTYYLIEFMVAYGIRVILKVTRWTIYQLWYYLLSIYDFNQKITKSIEILDFGQLNITLATILAFGQKEVNGKSLTIIIQEFNESMNYVDFTRELSNSNQTIPVNLVQMTWKFLHENGFMVDSMPKNFHITFNHEEKTYELEYIDFIHSNDPVVKEAASSIADKFENGELDEEKFEFL